jgi:hypothetical protein
LSETTGMFNKYPSLMSELKKDVPSIDLLDDPVSFYRARLEELGMVKIQARTYFDRRLAVMTSAFAYRGELSNKLSDDQRGFHEESLRALGDLLADDLSATDDNGEGWQVAVKCTKPGTLVSSCAVPKPICLACKTVLDITPDTCACPQCGTKYRNELGDAFVLSNYRNAYSPKSMPDYKFEGKTVDDLISQRLNGLNNISSVSLFGFDRLTRYLIKSLSNRGISVQRIYTDNQLFEGHSVLGIPLMSYLQARDELSPIVMSLGCHADDTVKLHAVEYRGKIYGVPKPSILQRLRRLTSKPSHPRFPVFRYGRGYDFRKYL